MCINIGLFSYVRSYISVPMKVDWLNKFIEYMWPYLDKVFPQVPMLECYQKHIFCQEFRFFPFRQFARL